jgi:formylglycine-generating enzyme required for sulfatase activity
MGERFLTAYEAWAALDPVLAPAALPLGTVPSAPAMHALRGAGYTAPLPGGPTNGPTLELATVPLPGVSTTNVPTVTRIAGAYTDPTPGAGTTSAPTLRKVPPPPPPRSPRRSRSASWLAGGAAAIVVVGGGLSFTLRGDKHAPVAAVPPSATSASTAPPRDRIAFDTATFTMGSAKDAHKVFVPAFVLDRTEVTVAAYRACVDAKRCTPPDGPKCNYAAPGRDDHPVDCVTQAQSAAYCASKGMRLPTEEEWEYAARGAEGRAFPWKGDGATAARACYGQATGTCPVGSHPEGDTPEGVADLAGNVWEWTKSPFCPYTAPGCVTKTWVIRGGSASSKAEMIAATVRFDAAADDHYAGLGFRCAADAGARPAP